MKLCDLTQFYSPLSGGVKRYIREKIRFIEEQRPDDEHVLIIPGATTKVATRDRSRVYSIRSPLVSRSSQYRALLNLRAIDSIIERERPDIIESSDPYQVGWKAATLGRRLRIPVIAFYHSHFSESYLRGPGRLLHGLARTYTRELYSRYDATLVTSGELAGVLRHWGVANVHQVSLGVNSKVFFPDRDDAAKTRDSLGIAPGQKLLLYVGRLAQEKNTETLFDACQILMRRRSEKFVMLVIGDGPQGKLLRPLQKKNAHVRWIQYCTDPAELAHFYRSADLFVHPGVQETFGLAALESQACGTPVVGIRGSRMDQIICHAQESWAKENKPEALADAIEEFSNEDLGSMGNAAAQAVAARYSWPNVFGTIFQIYRETILSPVR